jgi:diguanylate cyclase (GGDEF)-like protein
MKTLAKTYDALTEFLYRAPIGMIQTTLDGTIEILNPLSARLLMPLSRDGNVANLFDLLRPHVPQLDELLRQHSERIGSVVEAQRIHFDVGVIGNSEPRTLSLSLLKLENERLMGLLSDISLEATRERRGLARRLGEAAQAPILTSVADRAQICARIQRAIDRAATDTATEFAVLFLNCDRFRQINDTLGHTVGDEVLRLIPERLRSILRGEEHLAGRINGAEFVVVLERLARAEDVHAVAQRLLDKLAKPYGIGEHQVHCGMSVGVVLRAQAQDDAEAVLQKASIAMVEAKRTGGGRYVVFEPAMQERAAHRSGIEVALRHALAERELFVMYQPIVRLPGDPVRESLAGVEALVRWHHPSRGLIPPLEFISVAEECGLIGAVGDFVLSTACHQFAEWQRKLGAGAPQMLAVNLSRAQLLQPELVGTVSEILRSSGMRARQLQLEVTESLAAQDERVQRHLHALKELRLSLALDDFGTGYSSLASLHQLPIDTVKIDRSFVAQVDTSHHHRVLIEATVRVAQSLGMNTVAEGIETRAQAAAVQSLGCEKGQGYLFSKPLAAADIGTWLQIGESALSP